MADFPTTGQSPKWGPQLQAYVDAGSPVVGYEGLALSRWNAALAAARKGAGYARLLCIGDSTTTGIGSDAPVRANSWPSLLVSRFDATLCDAYPGMPIAPNPAAIDPRFAVGAGWAISGGIGPAGLAYYCDPGGGLLSYAPGYTVDGVDFWLYHSAGLGTIQFEVSGIAWGDPINCATGGAGWVKHSLAFQAQNDWVLSMRAPTGGPVYFMGFEPSIVETGAIRVANWGSPGSRLSTWVDTMASLGSITAYDADLALIMLGINDATPDAPVTRADYKADLETLVDTVKVGTDVALMTPFQPSVASTRQNAVQIYNEVIYEVAASREVPVFDMYRAFGPHETDYVTGLWADDLHLSTRGNVRAARLIHDAITSS